MFLTQLRLENRHQFVQIEQKNPKVSNAEPDVVCLCFNPVTFAYLCHLYDI